ncbi:helix-turn-helix domain-containing protein [Cohnella sp. GCM10027633]|uniref:helix-turn-helix domain-containing protein n=1 Tax=unclassified Cohnella TaxID=2636738 RepID=UPI00362F3132
MHTADIVQNAIDYIEEHLFEPLALERIAGAAAMSVPQLYRLFHAMTGHPIKEYVRKRRTSEAGLQLRYSKMPANEIGYRLGFETYQTFIKAFKRHTGLTPGLYRQSDCIYSFESIVLREDYAYAEDRDVSARYPDVRVVRLASQAGIGFLHVASFEEGLEEEALGRFRSVLADCGLDSVRMKLFGWNVEISGHAALFGYQMVAVGEAMPVPEHPLLTRTDVRGNLYAMTRVAAGKASDIVAAWNRLLSEWLPRSTFELGEEPFLEEYLQHGGQIVRLKLYLPVRRRLDAEPIVIVKRDAASVIRFRAEGPRSADLADEAAIGWINRNVPAGHSRLQLFMSRSHGHEPGEDEHCELLVSVPNGFIPMQDDEHQISQLEGGTYACIRTKAYGSMTGVLDRIYRWLGTSADYAPDDDRTWYAAYVPGAAGLTEDAAFERSVEVECCVPILTTHESEASEWAVNP